MYDKCYFCLDQLPKLKKESTVSFFVNFGRSRGTKEPTYITLYSNVLQHLQLYGNQCQCCKLQQCIIGCKGGGSDHLQWSGGDQAIQPDQFSAVYTEQCGIVQCNVLQCGVGSLLMRCWLVSWG